MTDLVLSRRCILAVASSLLGLTGCSLLAPQSAPQLYRLTPRTDDAPPTTGPRLRRQLAIAVPEASQSLDTERIALTRNRTTLDYYAGSAWTDRAPVLLQGLLVEAFENSGQFAAVGPDSDDFAANYRLETELRDFGAHYADAGEQPPTVAVGMDVKLVKLPDRQIIDSVLVDEHVAAMRNDLDSIVDAFDIAVGRVLARITTWTVRVMTRAR